MLANDLMPYKMTPGRMEQRLRRTSMIAYVALAVAFAALALGLLALFYGGSFAHARQPGNTLQGIDQPLTQTQLAAINGAPNAYFEQAGEMMLNGTLNNPILLNANRSLEYQPLVLNGKPSVVYVGAITCIYCGENRWAMALALSRFGSFKALYKGYSALGDGDVPTLYWTRVNYTTSRGVAFGNNYSSGYINFISADYETQISGGFVPPPSIAVIEGTAPNSTYAAALAFMNATHGYEGTPFTFWGVMLDKGADGIVFGNSTPTSAGLTQLAQMTHQQVIEQLSGFKSQFAWSEYAAADVYVSQVCAAINNTAPVCGLPAIGKLESVAGIGS